MRCKLIYAVFTLPFFIDLVHHRWMEELVLGLGLVDGKHLLKILAGKVSNNGKISPRKCNNR